MIVYRDVVRRATVPDCMAELRRLAREDRASAFLVELGIFEQGAVDALHRERDGWTAADALLRSASRSAGMAFTCASPEARGAALSAALDRVERSAVDLPPVLELRSPEGYGHYALDPAAYAAAARAYRRDAGPASRRALVIGIRSIGTSLSAVVCAVTGTGRSVTVRPRGPTSSRAVRTDAALTREVRASLEGGGDVLVVDEGPGVTGETFECVWRWLRSLGVAADRIVLFPSHDGPMPLAGDERRAWFRAVRRYLPPLQDERPGALAEARGWAGLEDLSGGRWRTRVRGARDLVACPHFERLKYRAAAPDGSRWQLRYVGLGSAMDRWLARAQEMEPALGRAAPESAGRGFAVAPWIEGVPLRGDAPSTADLRGIARYLVARSGRLRTAETVDTGRWLTVLTENGGEAAGVRPADLAGAARLLGTLPPREAVLPDGRMRAGEWLRTADGLVKVDALDHGDGFRLPGPADSAWDLAAAAIEFGLSASGVEELVGRCAAAAGEDATELRRAVVAYRPVYAATCFGDAALSGREAADAVDRERLAGEAARYARILAVEAARAARLAPDRSVSVSLSPPRPRRGRRNGRVADAGAGGIGPAPG